MAKIVKDRVNQIVGSIGCEQKEAEEHLVCRFIAPCNSLWRRRRIGGIVRRVIKHGFDFQHRSFRQRERSFVVVFVLPVVVPHGMSISVSASLPGRRAVTFMALPSRCM